MAAILVVDDDVLFARSIIRRLRSAQFDVEFTDTVGGALNLLARRRPEVLLADLEMDDESGLTLIDAARTRSPGTHAVLMSGVASQRDCLLAMRLGAVAVLRKPFSGAELIDTVALAASSGRSSRANVDGLSLLDLIQLLVLGRKTARIEVGPAPAGIVDIRNGQLIHAACGDLEGEPAVAALLRAVDVRLRRTALDGGPQSIARSTDDVLLAALPDGAAARELDLAIEDRCRRACDETGSVACAVMSCATGRVVGSHGESLDAPVTEGVARLAGGGWLGELSGLLDPAGATHDPLVDARLSTAQRHYFVAPVGDGQLLILGTDRTVSVGLGHALLRSQLDSFAVPAADSSDQRN